MSATYSENRAVSMRRDKGADKKSGSPELATSAIISLRTDQPPPLSDFIDPSFFIIESCFMDLCFMELCFIESCFIDS
jgi:hypothetical protein